MLRTSSSTLVVATGLLHPPENPEVCGAVAGAFESERQQERRARGPPRPPGLLESFQSGSQEWPIGGRRGFCFWAKAVTPSFAPIVCCARRGRSSASARPCLLDRHRAANAGRCARLESSGQSRVRRWSDCWSSSDAAQRTATAGFPGQCRSGRSRGPALSVVPCMVLVDGEPLLPLWALAPLADSSVIAGRASGRARWRRDCRIPSLSSSLGVAGELTAVVCSNLALCSTVPLCPRGSNSGAERARAIARDASSDGRLGLDLSLARS